MPKSRRRKILPSDRFILRTFATPALYVSGAEGVPDEIVPLVGKQFGLLAFLASKPNRAVSRETLTKLFAPGGLSDADLDPTASTGTKARGAVKNVIRELRSKLGADALGPPGSDPVVLTLPLASDRDEFITACERGEFTGAVQLYRGDFLLGLEDVGRPAFAHWLDGERTYLRKRFLEAARHAIALELVRGTDRETLSRTIDLARSVRDNDPLAEDAWQHLIRCLIQSGEYSQARLEAANLRAVLVSHGVEPDSETRRILELSESAGTSGAMHVAQRGFSAGEPNGSDRVAASLVGRDVEVAAILASWDRARAGAFEHVHIVGPAGFGKSRLVAEVFQRLHERFPSLKNRTVNVSARQSAENIAYALVADLARALVDCAGAAAVPESVATTLVTLNPAILEVFKGALPGRASIGDEWVHTVVGALHRLIAEIALEGPFLIVLDDVHWSDADSLRILASTVRDCANLRGLFVTAGRDECVTLCAAIGATRIEVGRFDVESIATALSRAATLPDTEWAARLAPALEVATSGSPLLLVETLHLLSEQALLTATPNGWHSTDARRLFAVLFEGGATRRRIDRLSPLERRLLLLLAVTGSPLSAGRLRAAADSPLAEFNAALTALEARGFVARSGADWTAAHEEYSTTIIAAVDGATERDAAIAVGRAIVNGAGDDLRELQRAGPLLELGADPMEFRAGLERFVRLSRSRKDRRPVDQLVRDFVGNLDDDKDLLKRRIGRLPSRLRLDPLLRQRAVRGAAVALTLLAVAAVWSATKFRTTPRQPDAVLVAMRTASGDSPVELFPIPVDANHWAGISVVDVRLTGRPWRRERLQTNGGTDLRPDHDGWTSGVAVPDSGIIDVFDFDLDGHTRRLTFAPLDDYAPSWAPDNRRFAFVTSRWSRHGHYDLAIYDTLTHDVRHLTEGDDTDWEPHWSPDGSRIAFIRQYAQSGLRGLCVIDSNGENLRCLPASPSPALGIAGWADAHRILLRQSARDTDQLTRFNFETDSVDLTDARGGGAVISPDGHFALCRCAREGYPPGTWIVYPLERPGEFGVLRTIGSDSGAITFDWAPTTPRAPFLARLTIAPGLGPAVLGSSYQLRAFGVDTRGGATSPGVIRWRSDDTSMATVDSTGLLTPRRAGRVTIKASAGGWRQVLDTLTIVQPISRVVLDEDWMHGLEPTWRPHGVPEPKLVPDARFGHAFFNNGDGSFFSGAYTSRAFGTGDGLWVEAEVSATITASESQEQLLWLFAMTDSAAWANWDHATGDGPPVFSPGLGVRYPQGAGGRHFGEELLITDPLHGYVFRAPTNARTGLPFRVVMQIFPDGRLGVALNGRATWVGAANFFQPAVHLMLAGNTVDTRIVVGHLRIVAGIAPNIAWDSAAARKR